MRRKKKFEVLLQGGLGNQLFIWAFATGLALERQQEFTFIRGDLKNPSIFDICRDREFLDSTSDSWHAHFFYRCVAFFIRFNNRKQSYRRIGGYLRAIEVGYIGSILDEPKLKRIEGYFQSFKYAEGIPISQILNVFEMSPTSQKEISISNFIVSKSPIAIHIRLGDYFDKENDYFGILSQHYYLKALTKLDPEGKKPVLIVSDSPSLVREHMPEIFNTNREVFFVSAFGLDTIGEFKAISYADKIVIGNSTFSWWAAYLSEGKTDVVAPEKWFRSRNDPQDILPPHWKTVPSEWI